MVEALHKHSVTSDAYQGAKAGTFTTMLKGFAAGAVAAATWAIPIAAIAAAAVGGGVGLLALSSEAVAGYSAFGIASAGWSAAAVTATAITGAVAGFAGLAGAAGGAVAGGVAGTAAGAVKATSHNRTVDSVEQAIGQQQQMNAGIQVQRQQLQARGMQAAAVVQSKQQHHAMSNPALQAAAPQNVVANEMEHAGRVDSIGRAASMA